MTGRRGGRDCPGRLTILPSLVREKLRTGVAITSPAHCIEELIHNALDAGSNRISVEVDLHNFKFRISDNGNGIEKEDLEKIGQRYFTSKCKSIEQFENGLETLGYRGEAIASIVDAAEIVQIESKVGTDSNAWTLGFRKGQRGQVTQAHAKQSQSASGTTITVLNFLYNFPVRRQMISHTLDMEDIKSSVIGIALSGRNVSFSLYDSFKRQSLVEIPKAISVDETFKCVFGRQDLISISSKQADLSLNGVISSSGANSKRMQFISVNGRIMKKTQLHKIVREVLKQGTFCKPQNAQYDPQSKLESPSKTIRLYPVFCLTLTCPLDSYDVSLEPRKTNIEFIDWDFVTMFLKNTLNNFLATNNLLPPELAFEQNEGKTKQNLNTSLNLSGIEELNSSTSSDLDENTFESSSNKDVEIESSETDSGATAEESPVIVDRKQLWEQDGVRISKYIRRRDRSSENEVPLKRRCSSKDVQSTLTLPDGWIEKTSKSGKLFYVQVRSGMVVDSIEKCHNPFARESHKNWKPNLSRLKKVRGPHSSLPLGITSNKITLSNHSCESRKTREAQLSFSSLGQASVSLDDSSKWRSDELRDISVEKLKDTDLSNVLSTWQNPNFFFEHEVITGKTGRSQICKESFVFHRSMLDCMNVLGQVDRKFIACTVTNVDVSSEFLVLFDQHAVHERVRLETLIRENFPNEHEVISSCMDACIEVRLSPDDFKLLGQYQNKLRKYGLSCDLDLSEKTCSVKSVPVCFLKRELSELKNGRPSPLKDLVQELLMVLAESLRSTKGAFSRLPKTLHNVLSSQACRTAVKFGDPLSLERCQSLLNQLQSCQSPFQCAHGRPAAAPIINVTRLMNSQPPKVHYSFNKAKLLAMSLREVEDS